MQTPMTSCHLILMWHKWNENAGDVKVTCFTSYGNLVLSHWACTLCMCTHGTHALSKTSMPKYLRGLMGMQADSNLRKITASHSQVQNTQNANKNMPNIFPIVYLNENLRYCNENLPRGKQEPLVHPYVFWHTTEGEKVVKTSFYFIYL